MHRRRTSRITSDISTLPDSRISRAGRGVRTVVALVLCVVGTVVVVVLQARGWRILPDLALLPVLALALSRGPVPGALLGLAAGWVVDLVPPGGEPLGMTALLYALAGLLAGLGRRVGPLPLRWVALVCLGASAIPALGRLLQGAWLGQQLDVAGAATQVAVTLLAAIVLVPPLIRLDTGEEPL